MLRVANAGMAFTGRIVLQKQTRTTEKMKDRGFMRQCLIIPGGPFTMTRYLCVKPDNQSLITDHRAVANEVSRKAFSTAAKKTAKPTRMRRLTTNPVKMHRVENADRKADFFFVWRAEVEKSLLLRAYQRCRVIFCLAVPFHGQNLGQGQQPPAAVSFLGLDLVGPEELPRSYGVDCD